MTINSSGGEPAAAPRCYGRRSQLGKSRINGVRRAGVSISCADARLRSRFPQAFVGQAGWRFRTLAPHRRADVIRTARLQRDSAKGDVRLRFGGRARRLFMFREDMRSRWPHGLTPVGHRAFSAGSLSVDDTRAISARGNLVARVGGRRMPRARNPHGLFVYAVLAGGLPGRASPFGADRFARWFAGTYRFTASWLDPQRWHLPGSPADQIRLAWQSREEWRDSHPRALKEPSAARIFLIGSFRTGSCRTLGSRMARRTRSGSHCPGTRAPWLNMIAHFRYPSGLRVSAEALSMVCANASIRTYFARFAHSPE